MEKETKIESFFHFFADSAATDEHEEEEDEKEEGHAEGDRINIDFDIARSLIDEVVPYSLEYFLGIKTGAEGDEEGLDMEDLDEEDMAELHKQYTSKTGGKKGSAPGVCGAGGDKKDCKQ